jgi:hypothetical protein
VPKPPNRTFVDGGDIQVDDENVTDDHVPNHDEENYLEPSVEKV